MSLLITTVDEWDHIFNYTYNNSSSLPTLTSLVTMVNLIQENLVFDDIIVYFIRFSLSVMVQIGFKPKIFTHKKMQVAENATRKLHFLLAFFDYTSVN